MRISQILGRVIGVVGVVLLIYGVVAMQKTSQKMMNDVTGHYSDRTMWYVVGGIAMIVGGMGITRIRK